MKRLFAIALMMVFVITASAQVNNDSLQTINMNRTFSVGGKAILCLRSADADKRDIKALSWTLENKRVADTNFVTLKVSDFKTGNVEEYQTWSDDVQIGMLVNKKDNTRSYFIFDDTFFHLRILDLGKGMNVILLYSDLRNDNQEIKF